MSTETPNRGKPPKPAPAATNKRSRKVAGKAPEFDSLNVSELIETSRAHTASLKNLANVTAQALQSCYEYETDEPDLSECILVVHELLDRVLTALPPLGIVSHDVDPKTRAMEIAAGCECHRRSLVGAKHITIATVYILKRAGLDPSDQNKKILASLRELEDGIRTVFEGLDPSTLGIRPLATG